MIYFTSDTHFNHVNILGYCKRPWPNLEEMNEGLIDNWNKVVKPTDHVWHLGDFAMGQKVLHKAIFDRLNGVKSLVRGNHDQPNAKMEAMGWVTAGSSVLTLVDGKRVFMRHIPPPSIDPYENRYYPPELLPDPRDHDIFLCGHVHEYWKRKGNVINVGVDQWGYKPVSFEELMTAEETP